MKKFLLLGSNYGGISLLKCAKNQGYHTIVTDKYDEEYSILKRVSDEQWSTDTNDIEGIKRKCKEQEIESIFAGISDCALDNVRELCIDLNKPFYCKEGDKWSISRNKRVFKNLCRKYNIRIAKDYLVKEIDDEKQLREIKYPVVVKPVDQAANRGVSFCYNVDDLKKAYMNVKKYSDNPDVIIEEKIIGEEYVAYYFLTEKKISFYYLEAACNQRGFPKYCYTLSVDSKQMLGYYLRETDPQIRKMIINEKLQEGMIWFQFKVDKKNTFYAIECGYRMSGSMMPYAVDKIRGFDHVKWMFDTTIGVVHFPNELPVDLSRPLEKWACSYLVWTRKGGRIADVSGLGDIKVMFPDALIDLRIQIGRTVDPYTTLGLIVFVAQNYKELCDGIKRINETIEVLDEDGKDMIIYFDDYDRLLEC